MSRRVRACGPLLLLVLAVGGLTGALLATAPATDADVPELAVTGLGTTPVAARAARSDDRAIALLRRASVAERTQAYSGTQFVSSWTATGARSVVLDIAHVPGEGSVVQVAPTAGGVGKRTRIFEPDGPPPQASIAGLDGGSLALLQHHYDVRLGGPAACVGRPTRIVEVHRRDAEGSLAGRFWVDTATGLVLRRQVVDETGRTVRASAFVTLDEHGAAMPAVRPSAMPAPAGRPLDGAALEALRVAGWTAPASIAGMLDLYDARSEGSGSDRVLHLSYSDGLSTVSLFEQRGRLDAAAVRDWSKVRVGQAVVHVEQSVPVRATWSGLAGGAPVVFTALSDASMGTLAAVVADLPHAPPPTSVWDRLDRGASRLGSWLDPFD